MPLPRTPRPRWTRRGPLQLQDPPNPSPHTALTLSHGSLCSQNRGRLRVYMTSADSVLAVDEGVGCPSGNPLFPCSGNGECDCGSGVCTCNDACLGGPACDVPNQCNGAGFCEDGQCYCEGCMQGPECDQPNCGAGGECLPPYLACVCDACHSGEQCTVECGGNGGCSEGECQCDPCWKVDGAGQ